MKEDLLTFIAKQFYEEKDLTYYTGLIDTFNSNKDDLIYSHKYDEKELKKLLKVEDKNIRKYTMLLGNASLRLNKLHKMTKDIILLLNINIENTEIKYNIDNILGLISNLELNEVFKKEYNKIDNIIFKLKSNLEKYVNKYSKNIMFSKYFDEIEDKYVYLNDYIKYDYNLDDIINKIKELYSKGIEEFNLSDVQVLGEHKEQLEYSYSIMEELNNINKEYELSRDIDRKELLERVSNMYKDISLDNLKIKYLDLFSSYLSDSIYFKNTIKKINIIKNDILKEYNERKSKIDNLYLDDYS